jgi:hypothetical protein
MKPHEPKTGTKQVRKRRAIKNQIEKGEKTIKRQSKKAKRGEKKTLTKINKRERTEDQGSDT